MRGTCIQRFIVCGRDSGESARHLLREVCVGAMSACAEESLLGSVRSEALLTDRAAHYVCYPGNGSRDRIITVRETEHGIAMSLLKVCQTYPCKGKLELQRVCQIARAELRRGVCEHAVIAALLAGHEEGAAGAALAARGAALAVREGDGIQCAVHIATVLETKAVQHPHALSVIDERSIPPAGEMLAPCSPPMAAPDTPPCTAHYACLVSRGRSFMGEWTPSPKSRTSIAGEGSRFQRVSSMAVAVPVKAEAMSPRALTPGSTHAYSTQKRAMISLAHEVRKTSRYIGMMPFVVYAYLRRVRVAIFFVDRLVDIVAEYAPFLTERCTEVHSPCTAIFCRCMVFQYKGTHQRVVRRLRSDRDVLRGNHWVIGVAMGDADAHVRLPPHEPCGGERCGQSGGTCMSPLIEDLLGFGIAALPTAAQGDCGLDVMAYWDGVDRTPNQWKRLRLEVGAAIEGLASDPQWHTVFTACAELPSPDAAAVTTVVHASDPCPAPKPPPGEMEISAALAAGCDGGALLLGDRTEMAAAIAYFCGGRCNATAVDVGVLTMQLSPVERADILQGYRSLTSHEVVPTKQVVPGPLRQNSQRQPCRLSVRRACANSFLEWCARRHIDVGLKPLPYGCVRDYFKETGLHGRQHAAWLVRQARALRCTGLNARGVVRAVASSGRRRMPGAGRPHKAAGRVV